MCFFHWWRNLQNAHLFHSQALKFTDHFWMDDKQKAMVGKLGGKERSIERHIMLQGQTEAQKEQAKLEWKRQEEMTDAFGNTIKVKAPKKVQP